MILYQNDTIGFLRDVDQNQIADLIQSNFEKIMGRRAPESERNAWNNSMHFMNTIVRNAEIEDDCGILVEYKIPLTSNRIDFVIAGTDDEQNKNFIIIELKQWSEAKETSKDGIVATFVGRCEREVTHPSYQAWSYMQMLKDHDENVETLSLNPLSCAYLHNYTQNNPEPLLSNNYANIVKDTPIYFKDDTKKLQNFINKHVGRGKGMDILYDITNGKIRPSKKLIDHVCAMFKGNNDFVLVDSQKVAFETALDIACSADEKTVLIIKGGPGTGKSVISVNLLGALLKEQHNVVFVAPNAAFRTVMVEKLAKENKKKRLRHLFKGSSSFVDVEENTFDTIVVDEAHRLKNGSAYQYKGENQLVDIINACRSTILFIDDDQKIRPEDIGSVDEIKRVAKILNTRVYELELETQFRCAGAEGYINWLNNILQIKQTGNFDGWDKQDFDFKIFIDPNQLRRAIKQKSNEGFEARLLAGYAWPWTKKGNSNSEIDDVVIPEFNFSMPWNSRSSRTTWAIDPSGINQVGCIHTSQGLEFDYVGIIVGKDLRFDPEKLEYYVDWKNYKDSSGKKTLKNDPEALSTLVKNIYKILMSRALKGCYVYFMDKALEAHFKQQLNIGDELVDEVAASLDQYMPVLELDIPEYLKYQEYLPVYSFAAACGQFGEGEPEEVEGWVKVSEPVKLNRNMFVVRAHGRSMEPRIPDGSYCVFRAPVVGSRNDKIVLVQHRNFYDEDTGGAYSIKKYSSEKQQVEDSWQHERIRLIPLNKEYEPIEIKENEGDNFTVIAELVGIL